MTYQADYAPDACIEADEDFIEAGNLYMHHDPRSFVIDYEYLTEGDLALLLDGDDRLWF